MQVPLMMGTHIMHTITMVLCQVGGSSMMDVSTSEGEGEL